MFPVSWVISYIGYPIAVLLCRNHLKSLFVGDKNALSWEHTAKPRGKGWNYFPKGYIWESKLSFSPKSFPSSETQNRKTKPQKKMYYDCLVSISLFNICDFFSGVNTKPKTFWGENNIQRWKFYVNFLI